MGVAMTPGVGKDCLIGWAQDNWLRRGKWVVGGKKITPASRTLPTFIAIPENDHVVPQACARPLADTMPHARTVTPHAGHVSMIVGSQARRELWQPLSQWLKTLP